MRSRDSAQGFISALGSQNGLVTIVLADLKSHTVLAGSHPVDVGRDLRLASDQVAAEALREFGRTGQIANGRRGEALDRVIPVLLPWDKSSRGDLTTSAAIYLRHDAQRIISSSDHLGQWIALLRTSRVVLISLLAFWMAHRHIMQPTRQIMSYLRAIAAGQSAVRIPDLGKAELGQVAERLNETLDQLAKADHQVRTMALVAPVGIFWSNPQGKCLRVNPAWSRMTGLSETEAVGTGWLQSIYPPDCERLTLAWSTPDTSTSQAPQTYRLVHRDGTLRWVLRSILPLPDEHGQVTGYIGSFTDITVLRTLEDQLRQSEEKHRTLFETMTQGVFAIDSAGRITDANPAAEELTGLRRAELVAGALPTSPHWRLFDENRQPIPLGNWTVKQSLTTGENVRNRIVGVVHHLSGLSRWFQVNAIGVRSTDFALAGTTFVTFHEITAVREAELALRKSEALYSNLVETSRSLIFQCDALGRFVFLNSAWERTLGYSAAEMLGRLPTNFCAASAAPAEVARYAEVLSGRGAADGELVLRTKSGHLVELVVRISPLVPGGDPAQGTFGTADDVTEQKKSERARKATEQLFTSFFVNANEAMVIGALDEQTILEANEAANRLFGYPDRTLIGRDGDILMDATDPRLGPAMQVRERTGIFIGELSCVRRTGEKFAAEITSITYTGRNGLPQSGTTFRDLRAQKELLAIQLRSQRLESIGTLTGGIAHDFNNALGPILLGFDLLKKQYPERAGLVDNMRASTARAAATVRQLTTFARGSDGTHLPVSTDAMFTEIVRVVTSTFPRDIQCLTSIPADTWQLLGDETQLQQVLLNLCLNARDAMLAGGQLQLEAANIVLATPVETGRGRGEPGNYVRWKVSDSGSGMAAEVLDRIFDPFFTTKGPGAGTGLGLAMVLGIVRGHGGFLDVQSAPEKGTTFLLFFPACPLAGSDPSTAPTPAPGALLVPRATLLVVDDEPIVRDVTATVLTALGFQVVTATDGTDALFKLANHEGDVNAMLTDLQMPHMNGQALVRVVVKMIPDLPIIAMSGKFTAQDEADLAVLGVRARLEKPFDEARLVAVLREIFPDGFQSPAPALSTSPNEIPPDHGQNTDT
jgi:PAS domain S-box-containing protein